MLSRGACQQLPVMHDALYRDGVRASAIEDDVAALLEALPFFVLRRVNATDPGSGNDQREELIEVVHILSGLRLPPPLDGVGQDRAEVALCACREFDGGHG